MHLPLSLCDFKMLMINLIYFKRWYISTVRVHKQKTTTTGGLGEPGLSHNSVPARRFQTNGLRSLGGLI